MKNILLTGATGLVGKNVLNHPSSSNYKIDYFFSNEADLTNAYQVNNMFANKLFTKPDVVINCSGKVAGVVENANNNYEFLNDNLKMGLNLVDACKSFGINKMINLGSTCMLPIKENGTLKEEDIFTGRMETTNEGYAIAKSAVCKACLFSNKQYNTEFKTIIPCNLFGLYDKYDPIKSHLLPAIIKKVSDFKHGNTNKIIIWGTGKPRREIMDAADLADFIYFALENWNDIPEVLNVAPGKDESIYNLYIKIANILGVDIKEHIEFDSSKPDGIFQKLTNTSKLKALGWQPKKTLEESVLEIYEKTFKV